jgi:hypothetical protein
MVWGFSVLGIDLRLLNDVQITITPNIDWTGAEWHFDFLDEPMK